MEPDLSYSLERSSLEAASVDEIPISIVVEVAASETSEHMVQKARRYAAIGIDCIILFDYRKHLKELEVMVIAY
jgi:Uma2 family endonuclease